MSDQGLALARQKMSDAHVAQQAIDVFSHYYRQLEEGVTGFIAEDSIEPLTDPDLLDDVTVSDTDASAALAKTVIIKLNGGLGTSMGMDKAKSLLPVRDGKSFLDIIVDQVLQRADHPWRQAAADLHEQLPDPGRHPGRAGAVPGARGRRSRAGLPAELRAQAARRRPHPGRLAGRSRAWSGARPATGTSTRR